LYNTILLQHHRQHSTHCNAMLQHMRSHGHSHQNYCQLSTPKLCWLVT
jgi:hypothetical protein